MRIHNLKTWPSYWRAVQRGAKTFEVRRNDRDFDVGDLLVLRMWDPHSKLYITGNNEYDRSEMQAARIHAEITYVLQGGQLGIEEGYCVIGLRLLPEPEVKP